MTQAEKRRIEDAKGLLSELSPVNAVVMMTSLIRAFTERFENGDIIQQCDGGTGQRDAVGYVFSLASATTVQREMLDASLAQHAE